MKEIGKLAQEQLKSKVRYKYCVVLCRRYWDNVNSKYTWDEPKYYEPGMYWGQVPQGSVTFWGAQNVIDITNRIISIGNIQSQLDAETLTEWRTGSLQLVVDNSDGFFDERYSQQLFDYTLWLSKIKIYAGFQFSDGTEQFIPIYTGLISQDIVKISDETKVALNCQSMDFLLQLTNAEDVSINVTNELLGIGDGIKTEFETVNNGVGRINKVTINGVEQKKGKEYSISNLNIKDSPAKIIFETPPGTGQEVRCWYIYWYQNKSIEWLLEELIKKTSSTIQYDILPVNYSSEMEVGWEQTSYQDFNLGVLKQNIDILTSKGDIKIAPYKNEVDLSKSNFNYTEYADGYLRPNFSWDVLYKANGYPESSSPVWNKTQEKCYLIKRIENEQIRHILYNIYSYNESYVYYYRDNDLSSNNIGNQAQIRAKITFPGSYAYSRVSVRLYLADGIKSCLLSLTRYQGDVDIIQFNNVTIENPPNLSEYHTYRVAMKENIAKLYIDGIYKATITPDPTLENKIRFEIWKLVNSGTDRGECCIDFVKYAKTYADDIYAVLPSWDTGKTNPTWSNIKYQDFLFSYVDNLNQAISDLIIKTQVSDDNVNWDNEYEISSDGKINSASKRFIRAIVYFKYIAEDYIYYGIGLPSPPKRPRMGYLTYRQDLSGLAKFISQPQDCGTSISQFLKLDYKYNLPENTSITFYTQSSSNGIDWESEKPITVDRKITSTVQRYIRWIAVLRRHYNYDNLMFDDTNIVSDPNITPTLYEVTIRYITQNIEPISLCNFTSLKVYDAIKQLAVICDYEFGFNADGKFFFKPKNTSGYNLMNLTDYENVIRLDGLISGWERIYNNIEVIYGNYNKIINPDTENETHPHSIDIYGYKPLIISGGNLLLDENVDIATGIAKRYYSRYKNQRRYCKAYTIFLPQLELSDFVGIQVNALKIISRYWGQDYYGLGNNNSPFLQANMRVVGILHDLETWQSQIDLEEV